MKKEKTQDKTMYVICDDKSKYSNASMHFKSYSTQNSVFIRDTNIAKNQKVVIVHL